MVRVWPETACRASWRLILRSRERGEVEWESILEDKASILIFITKESDTPRKWARWPKTLLRKNWILRGVKLSGESGNRKRFRFPLTSLKQNTFN